MALDLLCVEKSSDRHANAPIVADAGRYGLRTRRCMRRIETPESEARTWKLQMARCSGKSTALMGWIRSSMRWVTHGNMTLLLRVRRRK